VEGFGPGRFKETGVHELLQYSQYDLSVPSAFPQGAQSLYISSTVYAVLGLPHSPQVLGIIRSKILGNAKLLGFRGFLHEIELVDAFSFR